MWPLDYPSSLFSSFASSRKNFQKTIFDASLLVPPLPSSSQWLYRKHSIVKSGTLEEVFYIFPPIWFAHFQFSATTTWFFFALPSERFVYQTDRYFFPPREGWEMGDKLNTCTVKRHFAYMQMCLVRRFVSSSFDRHQHWSVLRSQENQWTRELGGEWGANFQYRKLIANLHSKAPTHTHVHFEGINGERQQGSPGSVRFGSVVDFILIDDGCGVTRGRRDVKWRFLFHHRTKEKIVPFSHWLGWHSHASQA